ncbi:MAG: extracellular solute-binding protein [Candidatus Izemoplasmatales bacterium]|jgi:multiple sugar transport system substrate-binding protein|nr:extracellular solute-binding protein [Candidatus Izemoplasmatales bacterium]MDD5293016.1 extracellular solute-binding protein [Candidatus Izemoplasmatales bacterium]
MKKFLSILLLGLLSLALYGCNDDTPTDRIEITFWHMSPVGSASFSDTRRIITEFNQSQDVYFVKGTGFSFWDYWDKIAVAISSRTAPDIGLSTIDDVPIRAEAGVLYNLSELIEADPDGIEIDQLYDSQLSFATYDGHLYALPFTATTRVLYYNLDMFTAAGLSADDVPTTWSELHTVAKQLDIVQGSSIQQLGFDPTYGNATYHGYLWQAGLDFFDEDLNPTLNTQGHIDVLQWMIDFNSEFTRSQLTAFGDANTMLGINPFAGERVAMMIEVDSLYQTIKEAGADFNFGVTSIPVPDDGGIRVNWGSGFSVEMYDNNKNTPDKKAGAWEFLKYLMSKDTQKDLSETNGWIMAHQGAMLEVAEGDAIMTRILEEVAYARDKVYVPYAPSWHGNDWQSYYNDALTGKKTAAQALADARANYLQKKANWEATR